MPAQLRLTLTDEEAEALDAARGAATRTAYASLLIRRALSGDDLEALLRRVVSEEVTHVLLVSRAAVKDPGTDRSLAARNAIRNLPSMR
jgi:hypothetical protein